MSNGTDGTRPQAGEVRDGTTGLDVLARCAHELAHAPLAQNGHNAQKLGRERLLRTIAVLRPHAREPLFSGSARRWLLLTAAASALLASVHWFVQERPLTYELQGPQPLASNYLVAPSTAKAAVAFSDGSRILAAPGARLRIDSTESRGARVLLEQGFTRAHVRHRERSNWVFVAGPFDVHVTGTTFTLAWDAASQALDLTLIEGAVEVESPLGASRIAVKSGQRFRASVVAGTMQLESADGSQAPALLTQTQLPTTSPTPLDTDAITGAQDAHAIAPGASPLMAAGARERHSPASGKRGDLANANKAARAGGWSDLVRAGAFDAVIEAANVAGLASTLAHGKADDVRALADAARYTARSPLALRALTVLRTRFPGSHHGAAAAFLLGRTYETSGQAEAAKRFYQLYRRESANGEFAAEALAGELRTVAALDGAAAARSLAREYLERYPNGVYAKSAQRLADDR